MPVGLRWYLVCSRISSFFSRHRIFLRRFYWFCAIAVVVSIIAIPIGMGIRNPHVQLIDFHGPSPVADELMREWNLAVSQARREQGRLHDFVVLVNHLSDNYPFVELAARRNGID